MNVSPETLRAAEQAYPAFAPALREVAALARRGGALVAIDGRSGSGKTTLAALLARVFGCPVVHTDDYYLALDCRAPGWQQTSVANMDLARLRLEVLDPLRAGRPAACRPYNAHEDRWGESYQIPAGRLVLCEGSYAMHPALGAYDLTLFVTCLPAVQESRLRAREGRRYDTFRARWVPLEEAYYRQYGIPARADLILRNG